MIDFHLHQDYPAALDPLWALFSDPDYPREKYQALGSRAVRILHFEATPQAIVVELERKVPIDKSQLPAWGRPLVNDPLTLHHHSQWRRDGAASVAAALEITPAGLPVRATGRGTIRQTAAHAARMALHWQVSSPVPVLGPRIERLFADQVRAALDADHAFTCGYMARRLA